MLTPEEIRELSQQFESRTPMDIIRWAVAEFGSGLALSTSFQTQSMPLLHMVRQVMPDIRIFFLDTGDHFWDTLIFREQVQHAWDLNVVDLYRDSRWDIFVRQNVRTLPLQDPNLCCYIHKVQPMQKALANLQAWMTGIRRDQTPERARANILEPQEDGLLKINPLLNWTRQDIRAYRLEHHLPLHPLYEQGYRSIGCAPCTASVGIDDDDRAGRWAGRGKTECGLHTEMFKHKNPAEVQEQFVFKPEEIK